MNNLWRMRRHCNRENDTKKHQYYAHSAYSRGDQASDLKVMGIWKTTPNYRDSEWIEWNAGNNQTRGYPIWNGRKYGIQIYNHPMRTICKRLRRNYLISLSKFGESTIKQRLAIHFWQKCELLAVQHETTSLNYYFFYILWLMRQFMQYEVFITFTLL